MPCDGPSSSTSTPPSPTTPRGGIKFALQDAVVITAINAVTNQSETFFLNSKGMIGKGGKGEVVFAQHSHGDKLVVAKIIGRNSPSAYIDYARECRNLKKCDRLIATAMTDFGYCIFMDHFPGINLLHYLYQRNPDAEIPKDNINYFISKNQYDIIEVLSMSILAVNEVLFFHQLGLAHRDLKPENYVLETAGSTRHRTKMRLIDLDSAVLVENELVKDLAGTDGYFAPELVNVSTKERIAYNFACDYFSLGIVLAEILTKFNYQRELRSILHHQALSGARDPISSSQIKSCMPDIFDENSPHFLLNQPDLSVAQKSITAALLDLINCLTFEDPTKRPTMIRLLELNRLLTSLECKFRIEEQMTTPLTPMQKIHAYRSNSSYNILSSSSISIPQTSSANLESVTVRQLRSHTSPPKLLELRCNISQNSSAASCSSRDLPSKHKLKSKSYLKTKALIGGIKKLGKSFNLLSLSHHKPTDEVEQRVENSIYRTFIPAMNTIAIRLDEPNEDKEIDNSEDSTPSASPR
ncbi:MAG: protein kinase [Gammaproteobacteria bacterium]|jgi:serine/threonine protein kinase|nr:protein kinase [Gammaproteobacteria bacterium]